LHCCLVARASLCFLEVEVARAKAFEQQLVLRIDVEVWVGDSRLEGGVNRAKLKFTNINTTTSGVSVRNINESAREGEKQIASK
jgi:hypothetical protein